jgi:hypothetical protein
MTIALAVVLGGLSAWAQDTKAPSRSAFFDKACVDFWGDKNRKPKGDEAKGESVFVEPIQLPDGRTILYTPPRPVLDFLDSPTTENALKYVQWQRERMKRLREAIEKLAEVTKGGESFDLANGSPKFELVYFKQNGCPACARQDAVLGELSDLLQVRTVTAREEFEASGVLSVPTLILHDLATKRAVRIEGATGKRELIEAMRSLRGDAPGSVEESHSKVKK